MNKLLALSALLVCLIQQTVPTDTSTLDDIIKQCIPDQGIVCDIGAHYGAWSALVRAHRPQVKIFACDPLLAAQEKLMARFPGDLNFVTVPCAITNYNGLLMIYEYPEYDSIYSSVYRQQHLEQTGMQPRAYAVQSLSFEGFCEGYHIKTIDFLNISAGGAEVIILAHAQKKLAAHDIKYIQFEYGPAYRDAGNRLADAFMLLMHYGYAIFKCHNTQLVRFKEWNNVYENYEQSTWLAVSPEYLK